MEYTGPNSMQNVSQHKGFGYCAGMQDHALSFFQWPHPLWQEAEVGLSAWARYRHLWFPPPWFYYHALCGGLFPGKSALSKDIFCYTTWCAQLHSSAIPPILAQLAVSFGRHIGILMFSNCFSQRKLNNCADIGFYPKTCFGKQNTLYTSTSLLV